ncbi:MAG: HAMP domain-containing sensor histidine kinase [Pseudomonadota bacterium]
MRRFARILKTTAFRLTLLYTIVFGTLAVGIVFYISFNTGRLLIQQFQITIDEEVGEIARIVRRTGIRRLIPLIEGRARQPGANLYLVADDQGRILAGNVRDLDRALLIEDGWKLPPFSYGRFDDEGVLASRAVARVFTLPGNLRLLVGRDIGEAERFRNIVFRASFLSLGIMALTGIFLWLFMGRRALKHLDSVTASSRRIMAGDLSQRLPLSGAADEFDRLAASLNAMIAKVETLNSGVQVMSDSIAHDLKSPLTRLRNQAEAAINIKQGKDKTAALQSIVDEADAIIATFNALLTISQVEAGARTIERNPIDLSSVVTTIGELYEAKAEDENIAFQVKSENAVHASVNRELISQATINLLDNAFKYGVGNATPQITLTLKKEPQHIVLSVLDNGDGVPDEDLPRVRERFVRLDKSRTKAGSGLGLSLVDAIARLHDGHLVLLPNNPGLIAEIHIPNQ